MKRFYDKLLCVLCICLCHSFWLHAGNVISTSLPFMDKLSANELRVFYQDREGFVWMGTSMGVARYDGYEIQEFRNNYLRPSLLADNNVVCFTDNDRFVWIGTEKGITRVDKQSLCFSPFPDSRVQREKILDLYTDQDNKVWVASNDKHLYRCDNEGKVEKEYMLGFRPDAFCKDRKGNMWIGTLNGGIYLYDKKKDSFTRYPFPHNVYRILQARSGHFWIATWDAGIWRFDPQRPKAAQFVSQPIVNSSRGLRESTFYDLVQDDADGYLWALSHFKLYVLRENAAGMLEEIPASTLTGNYGTIDQGKSYNRILKDKEGNLWLAAYDKSCLVLFKKDYVENFLLPDIHETLGFDANLVGLNQDRSGKIWMTLGRYGLCLYNAQTGKAVLGYNPRSLYSLNVPFLVPSEDGGMWATGPEKPLLYKLRQTGYHVQIEKTWNLSELAPDAGKTTAMEQDISGNLWLSTDTHLYVYPKENGRLNLFAKDVRGINDLAKGKNGKMKVLTDDKVYEVDYAHGRAVCAEYFSAGQTLEKGDAFKTFTWDGLGNCWIVTNYGRVLRVADGKKRTLTDFSHEFNVEGENIVRVLADKRNLWVIFQKRILQYGLAKGNYIYYTVRDNNIALTSFRRGAGFIDATGNLYVGGHLGFIKIRPDHTPMLDVKQKVFISDVSVGDSSVFSRTEQSERNTISKVYLRPSDTNVSILFSALQYDNSQKISYIYKLGGVDKDWVVVKDGKHRAFYNTLPKGTYTFKVRIMYPSGKWGDEVTTLTIVRLPALYETWYAYLFYLIVAASIVYFGRRLYFAYKEQRRKESERRKALENEINLMQQREEDRQKNLDNSLAIPIVKLDYESSDKLFLEEAIQCVEANLKNQNFDLGQLADTMNVSRSTLNRRVRSLCGITPLDMIRNIRLKHACEMLSTDDVSIADVAYATGFSTPRYFSKCFKDKFGVIPTEYQSLIRKREKE